MSCTLLLNLHELYVAYKTKYPNNKIGFSKFCELQPAWCLPVTAAGMHNVCLCQSHQITKLLTSVIPGKLHYSDLLEKNVCSVENCECMLLLCDNCPCSLTSFCRTLSRRTMTWTMRYRTSSGFQSTVKPC